MSIKFPLKQEITPYGPLFTPLVRLGIHTVYGWQWNWFLIDSGADFTTLPEAMASLLGVNLATCVRESVEGIEGRPMPARVGSVTLLIGAQIYPVRCHFLKSDRTPYLLGRMDIFSRFTIHFETKRGFITFVAH